MSEAFIEQRWAYFVMMADVEVEDVMFGYILKHLPSSSGERKGGEVVEVKDDVDLIRKHCSFIFRRRRWRMNFFAACWYAVQVSDTTMMPNVKMFVTKIFYKY